MSDLLLELGLTFDEDLVKMVDCFDGTRKMFGESGEINSVFFNLFLEDFVCKSLGWDVGLQEFGSHRVAKESISISFNLTSSTGLARCPI